MNVASPRDDQLVDAVLGASRALVAVAARSLDDLAEDVTLAQYRVLVELAPGVRSGRRSWPAPSQWTAPPPLGCATGSRVSV